MKKRLTTFRSFHPSSLEWFPLLLPHLQWKFCLWISLAVSSMSVLVKLFLLQWPVTTAEDASSGIRVVAIACSVCNRLEDGDVCALPVPKHTEGYFQLTVALECSVCVCSKKKWFCPNWKLETFRAGQCNLYCIFPNLLLPLSCITPFSRGVNMPTSSV